MFWRTDRTAHKDKKDLLYDYFQKFYSSLPKVIKYVLCFMEIIDKLDSHENLSNTFALKLLTLMQRWRQTV